MADPYLGQIECFTFGYAPKGWLMCAGQLLPINQYQALFSLLGTTYGGDGIRTFQVPDLRSSLTMGQGNGPGLTPRVIGEVGGEENHTLLVTETPLHIHALAAAPNVDVTTNVNIPGPTVGLAQTVGKDKNGGVIAVNLYAVDASPNQPMALEAVGSTGGQPHTNLMPYNTMNFCIATVGAFPSRN